jgi:photosystem II stability/assembly factor-like uncharacterized protein
MKTFCTTSLFLLAFFQLHAQWEKVYEVTDNNFYTLYALDQQRVFLGAEFAGVYSSSDGGGSFTSQQLQPYGFVSSFSFENETTGYTGGGCYFTFDECPGNTIYKTENGGQTWTQLLGGMFDTGVFHSIATLGGGKIIAASDYGGVIRSEDGGETWAAVTLDTALGSYFQNKLQFVDEQTGFTQISFYINPGNQVKRIYKTTDGGDSWNIIFEDNDTGGKLIDFHFSDTQHGLILSVSGKLQRSTDGGLTWTEVTYGSELEAGIRIFSPTPLASYISSFVNETLTGRIYRSTDGGLNWAVDLELDSTYIGEIFFNDAGNGWAVAEYRQLYRRTGPNGVKNTLTEQGYCVFPNPAGGIFVLKKEATASGSRMRLSDALGRVVLKNPVKTGENYVDASALLPGVYFLEVLDEMGRRVWSEKVVRH